MTILNQDRDEIFTLTGKGIFKSHIFIEVAMFQGQLMGYNIMGKRLFHKTILGTYDEPEAQQIVQEIFRLLMHKAEHYTMPQPSIDLYDMGVDI